MAAVSASSVAAESASDQCMPIMLPPSPTVTPLKARKPSADMANSPITRPRTAGGADGVGERHQRAAVDRAAYRRELLPDREARHDEVGRHLDELDSQVGHQPGLPFDFHLDLVK